MQTIKYIYWQEDDAWLGYLEEYPDYFYSSRSYKSRRRKFFRHSELLACSCVEVSG